MTDGNTLSRDFPCVGCSPEERKRFESISDDLVEKTLTLYNNFHGNAKHTATTTDWKLVRRQKSLSVYKERNKLKSSEDRMYLCSGIIPGVSIEDIIIGAYDDDLESMRIGSSIIMHMSLDARVVHVFEKNPLTSSVVFSGIKWMAIKTSAGGGSLIHDRDILFYDRLGRLIDSQGRHFVYSVMKSVELEEYPANQHNIERGEVLLCYLFRQFQEELVGCFAIGTSIMGGTLPQSIVHHITIERMLVVQNFPLVARAKAYSARIAKSTGRFPSTTNSCDVCMKKPRMLSSSLKICMGCRRNTCRKCREWCTVFRLDIRTQKPGKERFCTQCISDVTRPTMSAFYMCSLKESTNSSTHNEDSSSTSISSGAKGSSSPSSSRSHKNSDSDPNAWLLPSSDLDNFANFVERASLANLSDMQWNQEELDYYIDILQEVGHVNVSEFTEQNNCENYGRMQGDKHDFDPSSHYKDGRKMSRDPNQQFFSVDDLD